MSALLLKTHFTFLLSVLSNLNSSFQRAFFLSVSLPWRQHRPLLSGPTPSSRAVSAWTVLQRPQLTRLQSSRRSLLELRWQGQVGSEGCRISSTVLTLFTLQQQYAYLLIKHWHKVLWDSSKGQVFSTDCHTILWPRRGDPFVISSKVPHFISQCLVSAISA